MKTTSCFILCLLLGLFPFFCFLGLGWLFFFLCVCVSVYYSKCAILKVMLYAWDIFQACNTLFIYETHSQNFCKLQGFILSDINMNCYYSLNRVCWRLWTTSQNNREKQCWTTHSFAFKAASQYVSLAHSLRQLNIPWWCHVSFLYLCYAEKALKWIIAAVMEYLQFGFFSCFT